MRTRLRSWLAPPIFPDDERTQVAGVMYPIQLTVIGGFGVYALLALIIPNISTRRLLIFVPILATGLAVLFLIRRGHVLLAGVVFCASSWLIATATMIIGGGVRSPALGGYLIVVLTAGMTLGRRAALSFAALGIVASAAMLYATITDRLPTPYLIHTNISTWATQTIFLIWATVVLVLARGSIDEAIGRVRRELAERRRAEAALRESEARYRTLVSNFPNGAVLLFDRDLRYTLAEGIGLAEAGLSKVALEGKTIWEVFDPGTSRLVEPQYRAALAGTPTIIDMPFGDRVYRVHTLPLPDTAGTVIGGIVMTQDVTADKRADAALRAYTRRLEALRDIDRLILSTQSLNEIADAAVNRLCALIACNRAELLLLDWETEEAIIAAQVTDRPTSVPVGFRYSLAERPPRPALMEGQIVIDDDLSRDGLVSPSLQQLRDEGMRARMLVPLLVQGRLIGVVHLVADRPYAPTEEQRSLARELADHLAIGLQNARLLAEVQAANTRLNALSRQIVTAQEDERRRIARELHDEIGQALALVKLNIRAVQRATGATSLAPRLEQSLGVVEAALLRVRALALDLRPSMLDDLGLVAALRWYVDQQAGLAGITAEVIAAAEVGRLPTEIETVCFRVVQEALTNVVRHAQARSFHVTVEQHDNALDLTIGDDGIGFDAGIALARASEGQSGGLLGMRERVTLCGGRLTIELAAGRGTLIRAWIPLPLNRLVSDSGKERSA